MCCADHSAATKLALAPLSIRIFSYFPSNSALITGFLSFLSSSTAIFRCSFSGVVVRLSFLALSLTSEEATLDAKITITDYKLFFPLKTEATGYCIELAWDMAILVVAAWSVARIQQPYAFFSRKRSSSQGISIHPHCPGL